MIFSAEAGQTASCGGIGGVGFTHETDEYLWGTEFLHLTKSEIYLSVCLSVCLLATLFQKVMKELTLKIKIC